MAPSNPTATLRSAASIGAIARTTVDLLLEQITSLHDGDLPEPARSVIELPGTLIQGRIT